MSKKYKMLEEYFSSSHGLKFISNYPNLAKDLYKTAEIYFSDIQGNINYNHPCFSFYKTLEVIKENNLSSYKSLYFFKSHVENVHTFWISSYIKENFSFSEYHEYFYPSVILDTIPIKFNHLNNEIKKYVEKEFPSSQFLSPNYVFNKKEIVNGLERSIFNLLFKEKNREVIVLKPHMK